MKHVKIVHGTSYGLPVVRKLHFQPLQLVFQRQGGQCLQALAGWPMPNPSAVHHRPHQLLQFAAVVLCPKPMWQPFARLCPGKKIEGTTLFIYIIKLYKSLARFMVQPILGYRFFVHHNGCYIGDITALQVSETNSQVCKDMMEKMMTVLDTKLKEQDSAFQERLKKQEEASLNRVTELEAALQNQSRAKTSKPVDPPPADDRGDDESEDDEDENEDNYITMADGSVVSWWFGIIKNYIQYHACPNTKAPCHACPRTWSYIYIYIYNHL